MVWPLDILFHHKKAELLCEKVVMELKEEQIEIGRGKSEEQSLEVMALDASGKRINIVSNTLTRGISKNHALLTWDNSIKKYRFRDVSRYGSVVNGATIYHTEVILENRAKIEISGVRLQIIYS